MTENKYLSMTAISQKYKGKNYMETTNYSYEFVLKMNLRNSL